MKTLKEVCGICLDGEPVARIVYRNLPYHVCQSCYDKFNAYSRIKSELEPINKNGKRFPRWTHQGNKVTRCPRCGSRARIFGVLADNIHCPFCGLQAIHTKGRPVVVWDKNGEIDYLNTSSYTPYFPDFISNGEYDTGEKDLNEMSKILDTFEKIQKLLNER